jgi:hypothetical protein
MRTDDPRRNHGKGGPIPDKADRIELVRTETGVPVRRRGTVFYADHVQVLVKWDDGRSQSLRPGVDRFTIIAREDR